MEKSTHLDATCRGIKLSLQIKEPQTGAVSHCSCYPSRIQTFFKYLCIAFYHMLYYTILDLIQFHFQFLKIYV